MTWNTLDVPLETGWQCTLIPGSQYCDLTGWGRGYRNLSARQLYPNAGRNNFSHSWNTRPQGEADEGEGWEQDRLRQLADDKAAFAHHFRPNWDLRTITGAKALRDVQAFVRDWLNVAHWNLPGDNAALSRLLGDAVASGRLVPVVNREFRGVPRVAPPTHAPQRWPATGGGDAYPPKVYSARDFDALRRANGELPPLNSGPGGVSALLNPQPALGISATCDDGSGLLDFVESAAGALLGDAQPFDYQPDIPDGDAEELAGTTNEKYARKMFGYDNSTFRDMIHRFKKTNGIGPNDDLEFEENGDVYFNGDYIDNFHTYGN